MGHRTVYDITTEPLFEIEVARLASSIILLGINRSQMCYPNDTFGCGWPVPSPTAYTVTTALPMDMVQR